MAKLDSLANLSPEERELAIKILRQYSQDGKSDLMKELEYGDYEEVPVDIDTFLDDPQYLGTGLWETDLVTGQKRCTLFPFWRETLHKLFPNNVDTAYNTLILTGCLGYDTEIPLLDDTTVKIGDLAKQALDGKLTNKYVYSFDVETNRYVPGHLVNAFSTGIKDVYRITLDNGKIIEATANHKFLTRDKHWKSIESGLTVNDSLMPFYAENKSNDKLDDDKPSRTVVKIDYLGKQEVFDLTVEKYHNFAIGAGIVAHNSIGIGKTLCACAAMCYMLYRMLCLKDPYAHYGLMPMDKITFSMLNITLDAAKGVGWGKIQSLLQGSSWFMSHGTMNASSVNPQWQPKNGIELIFGSNNNHVVGRALFCLDGDTEVLTTDGTIKIKDLVGKEFHPVSVDGEGRLTRGNLCSAMPTARTKEEYEIHLADGSMVKCTPNHRLMLSDGRYKEAADLAPGDELLSFAEATAEVVSGALKVISITEWTFQDEKQFYDIIDAGPWHNFLIKAASGYVVSHNCNFIDEINFKPGAIEKQQKQAGKLVAQIDARMQSRFMRGTSLPTLNIIASSKNNEQSFLDTYINTKRDNSSKTTLIIDEPQWVVRTDKGTPDDPESFYVAVGNKFMAHELLPKGATAEDAEAYKAKGYHVIKVPPGYREAFEDNLDQALMDIAGISSTSSTKFVSGQRLNAAKRKYLNPFLKDVIEVGNAPDDHMQYANFFDLSRVSPKDVSKPLFIHLDLSVSGDKTGVSGVWIVGKKPGEGNDELGSKELMYKLAFSVSVKAPKGYQVSFEKTRNFIRWLRDRGFAVKSVSADTFQSYAVLQELSNDGFKTKITSVDRVDAKSHKCLPYEYLKSMIYEQKLQLYGKCDLLSEELVNLEKLPSGKVDHPTNGCFTGDTKVRLVDGRSLSFFDLVSEYEQGKINFVYSINNDTKKIEAKPIKKAWLTKKDQPLVRITLDSGESVECTPNHLFMLRDGSYCQAQNLLPGDSLMPLYTKYPNVANAMRNYRLYYEPVDNKWHYEHRQFASEIYDAKELVHHKNFNPQDNSPTNLLWMSKAAHQQIHAATETGAQTNAAKEKRKHSLSQYHQKNKNTETYKQRNEKISEKTQAAYALTHPEIIEKKQKKAQRIESINKAFGIDYLSLSTSEKLSYATKYARLIDPSITERISAGLSKAHARGEFKKAHEALQAYNENQKGKHRTEKDKLAIKLGIKPHAIAEETKNKISKSIKNRVWYNNKIKEILLKPTDPVPEGFVKGRINHKIISVEFLNKTADVYDMEVQDNHNFALDIGIFVHNSKDQADAVCGALFDASQFSDQYSYEYGDSVDAAFEVNSEPASAELKRKYVEDFQNDLAKSYLDAFMEVQRSDEALKQNDMSSYIDVSGGIIAI